MYNTKDICLAWVLNPGAGDERVLDMESYKLSPNHQFKEEIAIPDLSKLEGSQTALWIKLAECASQPTAQTVSATAKIDRVEGSGQPIEIRLPVGAALLQGSCYKYPASAENRNCFENGVDCEYATTSPGRIEVPCETVDGIASMQLTDAGGYYQVASSSSVPIIAGVTIACIAVVGIFFYSAYYFRKNPDSWENLKSLGPNKYKEWKRSTQSMI
jgi:hypothetical protein